jgi:hypothetical protein
MLKIALINASPKAKDSASGYLLEELKPLLKESAVSEYIMRTGQLKEMETLLHQDAVVFAFPLYVDGIPAHLLHCLSRWEELAKGQKPGLRVYAIVNCGFYEGCQNQNALQMLKNWCAKAGLTWGQGIGIGCGGMIAAIHGIPHGKGPKKRISLALESLAEHILSGEGSENIYTQPGFPRFLYKLAGEMGWRQAAKSNGLKTRDLNLQR